MKGVNMMSFFCSMMTIALSLVLVGCSCDTIRKTVEEKQNTQISRDEAESAAEEEGDMTPNAFLVISTGDSFFTVELENNASAQEFFEKVKKDSIKVKMHDYGSFEKVGELPWSITRSDKEITTSPGDLILYQGNQITIYYDENTWDFTKLGKLSGTEEEIKEAFGGKEDMTVDFYVEWTE